MPPVFDRAELLDRVGNDMAFLTETVEMLATDGRSLGQTLQYVKTAKGWELRSATAP